MCVVVIISSGVSLRRSMLRHTYTIYAVTKGTMMET